MKNVAERRVQGFKWGGWRPWTQPIEDNRAMPQFTEIIEFEVESLLYDTDSLRQKYFINGLNCREIAEEIGCARSSVWKYVHLLMENCDSSIYSSSG